MKRDFLRLTDLTAMEITGLWNRAQGYKKKVVTDQPLKGKTIGLVFEKHSTRTRVSFEVAIVQTGGYPLFISSRDTQMARNEPLKDTARVFSRYLDCLVVRTYSQKILEELAFFSSIPVVNALSDLYHPAQILSDLFTVRERLKSFEGLKIAWLGDGNNVAHSWMEATCLFPFKLVMACPPGFEPREEIWTWAKEKAGDRLLLTRDPAEAVQGAQVINTDVWPAWARRIKPLNGSNISRPFN